MHYIYLLLCEKIHAESLVIHCFYELIKHLNIHFLNKYSHFLMPVEVKYVNMLSRNALLHDITMKKFLLIINSS